MATPIRNSYFLTGATGALGREVLARLLAEDPRGEFTLLVRAVPGGEGGDPVAGAAARLEELTQYLEAFFGRLPVTRLCALPGDVERPRLGLSRDDHSRLAQRVTHIVHCAAGTKFSLPLAAARRINVGGTREVLALARHCARLVRLSHVSTAYVAGDREGQIREDELDRGQGFNNSYERSKFEAEILVRSYMESLPITVFRPSIIVGDSRDGHLADFATVYRPLRAIALGRAGALPGDPDTLLDLVPVDYVAEGIVRATCRPAPRCATYHLTAGRDRAIPVRRLIAAATARLRPGGDDVPRSAGPAEPRAAVLSLRPFAGYLSRGKEFDDSRLRSDLGAEMRSCPHPDAYLPALFEYYRTTDWGARRPWSEAPFLQEGAR
jgi:thioester reductase-like protein